MFLLSGSMHLSGGAPYSRSRWRSFTNGNRTDSTSSRLYTGNRTLRFIIYLLFSTVIILFIFIFIFISVFTYQKYKCVETTECKLYMCVDNTKITRGTIQCLWHEEHRIQTWNREYSVNLFNMRASESSLWYKMCT
jgi:hypothetical protein